jgi:hypothetical protein
MQASDIGGDGEQRKRDKIRGRRKDETEEKRKPGKKQRRQSIQVMRDSPWRQTNAAYSSNPDSRKIYRGRWN